MTGRFRLITDGACPGHLNMARDQTLLDFFLSHDAPQTLRFYQWDNPTVSLGYFQKAEKEVDFLRLAQKRFSLVRRPTGGRAVLHKHEVTFCAVFYTDGMGLWQVFMKIHQAIGCGLRLLDIPALVLPARKGELFSGDVKNRHSSACFASPSRYELTIHGRKVAGTAQKQVRNAILVHGSIPVVSTFDQLFSVLRFPSEEARTGAFEEAVRKMTSIGESTGMIFAADELQKAVIRGFEMEWGVSFENGEFSDKEKSRAESIAGNYAVTFV